MQPPRLSSPKDMGLARSGLSEDEMAGQGQAGDDGAVGHEEAIETPWGTATPIVQGVVNFRGLDGQATKDFMVETPFGLASLTYYADESGGDLPVNLRALLVCGYRNMIGPSDAEEDGSKSTLVVGGATLAWRAQMFLDPKTGLLADGQTVRVHLYSSAGKRVDAFPHANAKVGAAIEAVMADAAERTPGYAGRLYAAMLRIMERDLDKDVEEAERSLREAVEKRDLARSLAREASDAADASSAPSMGR